CCYHIVTLAAQSATIVNIKHLITLPLGRVAFVLFVQLYEFVVRVNKLQFALAAKPRRNVVFVLAHRALFACPVRFTPITASITMLAPAPVVRWHIYKVTVWQLCLQTLAH